MSKKQETSISQFFLQPQQTDLEMEQLFGFSSSTLPCRPLRPPPAACHPPVAPAQLLAPLSSVTPSVHSCRGSLGAAANCYTTVPPGELAWFGDDNKPCEQSSFHYSSKTQGSERAWHSPLPAFSSASPRAGRQALTHSQFHLLPLRSTALCLD